MVKEGRIAVADFSLGKFNLPFNCFCGRHAVGTMVDIACREMTTSGPLGTVIGDMRDNLDVIPSKVALGNSHGGPGPHPLQHVVPWTHPSPRPKRYLDRFSRFCKGSQSLLKTTLIRLQQ